MSNLKYWYTQPQSPFSFQIDFENEKILQNKLDFIL